MNRLFCFLTGGHRYADKNLTAGQSEDPDFIVLRNRCVKCGKPYRAVIKLKNIINNDIRRRAGQNEMPITIKNAEGYVQRYEETIKEDLEKAIDYFKEQLRLLIDNFGFEKHPEKIEAVMIAIECIEKEIRNVRKD